MFKRDGVSLHAEGGFVFYRTNSHLCSLQMLRVTPGHASSVDEVNDGVPNVLHEAILGEANAVLAQVDVEDCLLQNRCFLCFLLAKDWNAPGAKHRIIKPHQLHFREICSEEIGWLGSRICTQAAVSTELIKAIPSTSTSAPKNTLSWE